MLLIVTHITFALGAVPVGVYIFLTKKGTSRHKLAGRFWVALLTIVSMSAIPIQSINPEQYSLIHLLIPFTIGSLIYSIWSIRRFKVTRLQKHRYAHMRSMIGVYVGAHLIAGALTLLPGRFLHEVVFG